MAQLSQYHRVHKFPNGATLIYYKHNKNNTTQFYVGFLGGAQMDVIPGTAHFCEHMLIKESKKYTQQYIAQELKSAGIDSNAFTSNDYLMFYGDCPNTNIDTCLKLYSNLLFNTRFKQDSIDLERKAIDEEINMYAGDDESDYNTFNEMINQITVPKHITHDILGKHEDIAKIDEKALQDFIERDFVSENMVMTVVSNLDFGTIKDKMEKYFVAKAKSDPSKKYKYEKTKYFDPSNYIFKTDIPTQHTVEVAISYMSRKPEKETHLFSYVENFIFNDFAGRLLNELRTKRGLVYTAQYLPYLLPNNMSLNSFYALTSKEKVNETIDALGQIITEIANKGITQEELDKCKDMIITREIDRKNSTKTINPMTIFNRWLEGTEVFFNNQIHRVKELTLDQVNKYLKDTYSNTNVMVSIKGALPKNCYSTYEIQKKLNAKLSQVYFDYSTEKFYDYKDDSQITKKKAFEILTGITQREKWSNVCFVADNTNGHASDIEITPELQQAIYDQLLSELSIVDKVNLTNALLKNLHINFQLTIQPPEGQTEKTDDETSQEENQTQEPNTDELENDYDNTNDNVSTMENEDDLDDSEDYSY